ncbi:MAG: helix-turn-helix domain-containing protein [Polyangiaceae bacterium]
MFADCEWKETYLKRRRPNELPSIRNNYQAIESGQTNVTVASLVGIARAFGVKLAELMKNV